MEDVFQWLPDLSDERVVYDEFVSQFGSDDFVVITWPECTLADPRTRSLAQLLAESPATEPYVQDAVSGPELLDRLEEQGLDREVVLDRFEGIYFAADHERTCLVVSLTPQGMASRKEAIGAIRAAADEVLMQDASGLLIGGYPQVGAYGDEAIRDSIFRLVLPSCLLSTVAAWLCLRSLRMVVSILVVGGLAAGLSVAVVMLSGAKWADCRP